MRKNVLLSLLIVLASPLISAGVSVQVDGNGVYADDYYYDDDYGYYYGPGWYWGVWIGNENDYWRYHGNRNWHGHGGHWHGGGGHAHGGGGHGHH